MGWKAETTVTSVNAVGAVTLRATAEDITYDGDDVVTQVDVILNTSEPHLKVGDKVTVTGSC
jgi:hypothetical protein